MIRPANLDDALVIAQVQLQAYHEIYEGQWPQHYLESLSVEKLSADWQQRLMSAHSEKTYLVAEVNSRVVGFASGGTINQQDLEFSSELYTLYLLKNAQGRGLGKGLFFAVTSFLVSQSHSSMLCWIHSTNQKAQDFYKAMGGQKAREQMSSRVEGMLMYGFGWYNLTRQAI